jgi:O-antigen/teichoic acid export membrane protein
MPGEMSPVAEPAARDLSDDRPEVAPRRAVLDIVVQVVGRFGNVVLGVVATAILARGLGSTQYGMWTTALLVPGLLGYATELGFQQVAVRQAAAEDDLRWIGALATMRAVVALPTIALTVFTFLVIGARGDTLLAGTIVGLQAVLNIPAALSAVLQVRVRNDLAILGMTLNSVLWTVAVAVLMHRGAGVVSLGLAFFALATVTTLLQTGLALRGGRVPVRGTARLCRDLVRMAIPLSIGTILIAAYGKIDGLIVFSSRGAVEAGFYGAASRILDQATFIPMSLTVTLMPILARTWPDDKERARRILQTSVELLAMVGLFAVAFAATAGRESATLLYGSEFARSGDALLPLMLAYAVICVGFTCGIYTLVLGLTRRFARYALIALVFNVAINLVLVPRHGFLAAAWSTFVTEALVTGLIGRDILRTIELRPSLSRLARIAVAALAAGLTVVALRGEHLSVAVLLPLAGVVHLAALAGLRALHPDEIRALLRRDARA